MLLVFFHSLFCNVLSSQTTQHFSLNLEYVEENMTAQLEVYPQEKIHLHTDRDIFITGEKLWFKAYIVDAQSHLHPTYSEYVYVELISPADTLVNRVMIAQIDGMFHGHLPIPDHIPNGNYTLRAYTRYLENQGDDYFFKKNIRINSPTSPSLSLLNREGVRDIAERHAEQQLNSPLVGELEGAFDISFFPEGGNLLEGVLCKVAFKALNRYGYPETVSGYLTDETGAEIASVQTSYAGMGVFNYQPEAKKKFFLKCKNANGTEKQFELPLPDPRARSLTASLQSNRIIMSTQQSVRVPDNPYYLLVHSRGMVLHFSEWDKSQRAISFSKEQLPAGIIQFLLFDGQMNPLSERLVFNNHDISNEIEFQTDKNSYQIRDKVVSTLSFPDSLVSSPAGKDRVRAHFSVAVTDDRDISVDESTTILSSLLLSSELKGYIENPAYYLQDNAAMDLLMMTHGWRRYHIPDVVKGRIEQPQIPFQMFQELSGHVSTLLSKRPVRDSEVFILMYGDVGGYGVTSTNERGLFCIPELLFPDSTKFNISASNRNGRDNVRLTVDSESFPALKYAPQSPLPVNTITTETKNESDIIAFSEKAEQRAKYDKDIWTLQLNEVEVTAPRIRKDEPRLQFWANKSSDHTITRETIEKHNFAFIHQYLYLTGGVRVDENPVTGEITVYIRGNLNAALVLFDGIERIFDKHSLLASQIESIDIFKGPSAAAFGMRGANGVISITTKRGGDTGIRIEKSNAMVYTPLGYQKPVEFYAPSYETNAARQSPIPDYRTTIFWKPDVVISDAGEVTFEFFAADFSTTYSVVIEGITDNGSIVRHVAKIRVE